MNNTQTAELQEDLYEVCLSNDDVLQMIVNDYVSSLNEEELNGLDYFLDTICGCVGEGKNNSPTLINS